VSTARDNANWTEGKDRRPIETKVCVKRNDRDEVHALDREMLICAEYALRYPIIE